MHTCSTNASLSAAREVVRKRRQAGVTGEGQGIGVGKGCLTCPNCVGLGLLSLPVVAVGPGRVETCVGDGVINDFAGAWAGGGCRSASGTAHAGARPVSSGRRSTRADSNATAPATRRRRLRHHLQRRPRQRTGTDGQGTAAQPVADPLLLPTTAGQTLRLVGTEAAAAAAGRTRNGLALRGALAALLCGQPMLLLLRRRRRAMEGLRPLLHTHLTLQMAAEAAAVGGETAVAGGGGVRVASALT